MSDLYIIRKQEIISNVNPVEHIEDNLKEGEEADQVKEWGGYCLISEEQVIDLVQLLYNLFFNDPQEVLIKH